MSSRAGKKLNQKVDYFPSQIEISFKNLSQINLDKIAIKMCKLNELKLLIKPKTKTQVHLNYTVIKK